MAWWNLIVRKVQCGQIGEHTWLKLNMVKVIVLEVKFLQSLKIDKLLHVYAVVWNIQEFQILFEVHQVFLSHINNVFSWELRSDSFVR